MTDLKSDNKSRQKWNRNYHKASDEQPRPCTVLNDYHYLLPPTGRALDIACGLGGNALFLATTGLTTTAIDISEVGINKLQMHAGDSKLDIETIVASATEEYFRSNHKLHGCFDVIAVANYFDRNLFNVIPDLLAPGGLLFYQTFVQDKSDLASGPSNPNFLLEPNELLVLAESLVCRVFLDLGTIGQTEFGLRNQSCIVAQKKG